MCVCDDGNIGDEVIMGSAEGRYYQDKTAFLDMAIFRQNKWEAEIHAWTTVGGREPAPLLIVKMPINYCPKCGRRLSLGDAGRRKQNG